MAFSWEPGVVGTPGVKRVTRGAAGKTNVFLLLEDCIQKSATTGERGRILEKKEPEKRPPNSVCLTLWPTPLNNT